ncbi:MAG: EF-hand domain-containing protein [Candidatus Thiodiazotropha sp.]
MRLKKRHSALLVVHLASPNLSPRALIGAFSGTTGCIGLVLTGPRAAILAAWDSNNINKEQVMKKILINQVVAALTLGGVCGATAAEDMFMKLDRNGDGFISAEESIVSEALYKHWSTVDVNNDGRIDTAEFSAFEIKSESSGN